MEIKVYEEINLVNEFTKIYQDFYNGKYTIEYMQYNASAFDFRLSHRKEFKAFIEQLNNERHDIISSDREAATANFLYEYLTGCHGWYEKRNEFMN